MKQFGAHVSRVEEELFCSNTWGLRPDTVFYLPNMINKFPQESPVSLSLLAIYKLRLQVLHHYPHLGHCHESGSKVGKPSTDRDVHVWTWLLKGKGLTLPHKYGQPRKYKIITEKHYLQVFFCINYNATISFNIWKVFSTSKVQIPKINHCGTMKIFDWLGSNGQIIYCKNVFFKSVLCLLMISHC